MHRFTQRFSDFCEREIKPSVKVNYDYLSLSVCIIDCVYSLRAVYETMTIPVINRYAAKYLNGNSQASGDTVSMLIHNIDDCGGPLPFADSVLKNHQKIGGKNAISKAVVCYQLARYLRALHIETIADFRAFECQELLEVVIRSVKGLGDAGTNYIFMLAGDPNRCKPDVHIHKCIQDACGEDLCNDECQILFTDTVAQLIALHPGLTVRSLDNAIWIKYSQGRRTNRLRRLM